MKNQNLFRKSALSLILSILVLLLALAGVTVAWFTFSTSATVTPMRGTVTGGGVNLLIANDPNGTFEESCTLVLSSMAETIEPVTTADLSRFYAPVTQSQEGIPESYRDVTASIDALLLRGSVWIRAEGAPARIFLHKDRLSFGEDVQALAAMRLGIRVTTEAGTITHIFRLDDMADLADAESHETVPTPNTVYGGSYVSDPAKNIDDYAAKGLGSEAVRPANALFDMGANEMVQIDYYLYLEGCDGNCYNPVKARDIALALGFMGNERTE